MERTEVFSQINSPPRPFDEIRRVACVGASLIGQQWATLFALNGYSVILEDLTDEKVEKAKSRVKNHIQFLIDAGLTKNANGAFKKIEVTTNLRDAVAEADYVQESVFERYDVKKTVFAKMDEATPERTVLASSTSGLLMTEIQKSAKKKPQRCITAHPYNPAHILPLVEIAPGKLTSKETIKRTCKIMTGLGKVPVTVKKEVPGFIANRLSVALWREALDLVDKGVASVEDVDMAVRAGPGMRWAIMGPFLTYHLGGGSGGIEYFLKHIDSSKSVWLDTLAKWTITPESAARKTVKDVQKMVGNRTIEDLEKWRDRQLATLLKLLSCNRDPIET